MNQLLIFIFSSLIGYIIFVFFNDPIKDPSKKKRRLPKIRYKNLELLPYFRVHIKSKTYHIHHWLTLTVIVGISLLWYEGSHFIFLRGAAIGGIFQGLRYPTRFRFRHPREYI